MESHYRTAVDNFESLVTFVEKMDILTEAELNVYKYNVFTLKMLPAYGELPKPKTNRGTA